MTIFDRYLLRLFAKVLVLAFVSLAGLFVVIDFCNNVDEFVNYGGKQSGGVLAVVLEYYGPRMLWFFDRTAGLLAVLSSAFALTWMQRTNELTALLAAGIAPSRVVRPLLVASVLVALLAAANRELGLPQVRGNLSHNAQDLAGQTGRKCTPRYDAQSDVLIAGKAAYPSQRRIAEPVFRLPAELNAWGRHITAASAFHQSAAGGRPAGYLLKGVRHPAGLARLPSQTLAGRPVLLSPLDTPGLAADECFVVSVVAFEQLTLGGAWWRYLSTYELVTGLRGRTIEAGANVRLTLHARAVQPLLDLSLVLLGIPLVLGRASRNIFVAALAGGLVVGAVMIIIMTCHALGTNYVLRSATMAAWLPLILVGPVAYASARPLWD